MANVIARVEHRGVDDMVGGLCEIKQRRNIRLDGGIGGESLDFTTTIDDGANDPRDFRFRSAGNNDPVAFDSKPLSDRGAETVWGANPYNDRRALKRGHAGISLIRFSPGQCKAQSVSIGWFRQWPAENKIVVAQFARAVKNHSKGKDWRSEVLIVAGGYFTLHQQYERLRVNADRSGFIFLRPRLENVVRTIRSTLEFKTVQA
jgi:hypothetical protein